MATGMQSPRRDSLVGASAFSRIYLDSGGIGTSAGRRLDIRREPTRRISMRQSIFSIVLVTVLVCLVAAPLFAGITGDIQGTVIAPSGAAVAGAKVTITSVDTGQSRVLTTGSSGEFSAYLLDIGFYKVTIEIAGFKTYTQTAEVRNGEKTRIDASLTIGTVGQSVTVEATQLPTLDVSTAQLSGSLSAEEVQALPNLSRDPV